MPNFTFKFYAINGMEKAEIKAESVELEDQDGNRLELHPRKSDGEVTLYADKRLAIHPMAANCARVESKA